MLLHPKCSKCGNTDPDKMETITGCYSAPRRDGWRGALVLKGFRCMVCGTVEKIS
jgi:hypothetical protein